MHCLGREEVSRLSRSVVIGVSRDVVACRVQLIVAAARVVAVESCVDVVEMHVRYTRVDVELELY